jgi:hypothetical protein
MAERRVFHDGNGEVHTYAGATGRIKLGMQEGQAFKYGADERRERLKRPLLPQRPGMILHNYTVEIVKRDKIDYATALREACIQHPSIAQAYAVENSQREYSQSGDPDDLPSPEEAGQMVATYAAELQKLEGISYREALQLVRKKYPSVYALYSEGTATLKTYRR